MADSIAGVFATAGMHPHDAEFFDAAAGARIEELLHDPRVVAVGECGLDFYRMRSPAEDQIRALKVHIALSNESGKPMVVHVRDAWPDVLRVLDEGSAERVVIHCFSGDATIARECAERGYWISFAGNVTYPKNEHLRQAARAVDIDRLLVETDSPFLAPQKLRGTRQRTGERRVHHRRGRTSARRGRANRRGGHFAERERRVPRDLVGVPARSNRRSVLKVAVRVEGLLACVFHNSFETGSAARLGALEERDDGWMTLGSRLEGTQGFRV